MASQTDDRQKISCTLLFWFIMIEVLFLLPVVLHLTGPSYQATVLRLEKLREKLYPSAGVDDNQQAFFEEPPPVESSAEPKGPAGQDKIKSEDVLQALMGLERKYVLSSVILAHMAQLHDKGSGAPERSSRHGFNSGADSSVLISVKTGSKNLSRRLPILLLTWMKTVATGQVCVITDRPIAPVTMATTKWLDLADHEGYNITFASCPPGHERYSLCCKTGEEFNSYYLRRRTGITRWFCHFDDDVYVNVAGLESTLSAYDASEEMYIGRWPFPKNTSIASDIKKFFPEYVSLKYRYATGAAYCISDPLMMKVQQYLQGRIFAKYCEKLSVPDDTLIGIIITAVLGYGLTESSLFNSHINSQAYSLEDLKQQVTLSYSFQKQSFISIPDGTFSTKLDPTRFFSFHCLLYPETSWCKEIITLPD